MGREQSQITIKKQRRQIFEEMKEFKELTKKQETLLNKNKWRKKQLNGQSPIKKMPSFKRNNKRK